MPNADAVSALSETSLVTDEAMRAAATSEVFDRVLREYGTAMARLAAAYEPDDDEREDLLQDILFALWKALPGFRGDCSERTFVYRIAHNRALTHKWRERRRANTSLDDACAVPDPRADPARDAEARGAGERLLRAIQQLSPKHRQILALRLEDLSNREIAEVLGVNENAVAIRLTRARKALAEHLPNLERLDV